MKLVVDANVIIAAILIDDQMVRQVLTQAEVVAPTLIDAEVGNVLLKYVKHRGYSMGDASKKMRIALSIIDEYVEWRESQASVMSIASEHGLSFYDAIYLQVCLTQNYPLFTLDKKLNKAASKLKLSFKM